MGNIVRYRLLVSIFLALMACVKSQVQVDSYEMAWNTVNESYPYADFGGLDWQAVHDELLPKARKAKNNAQLKQVVMEMVGRLGESHFGVISMQSSQGMPTNTTYQVDVDAPKEDMRKQGWLGLDARYIDGKMIITRCNDYAREKGFQPGMEIISFNGESFTANVSAKRKQDDN